MKDYIIWTPPYTRFSGGVVVLHRLCHELNQRGLKAYVNTEVTNPEWNTPVAPVDSERDNSNIIAVYPEIVFGNPIGLKTVVRYLLNNAGKIGGPKTFDHTDILFSFSELFNDFNIPKEQIMWLPVLDWGTFYDKQVHRTEVLAYGGKSRVYDIGVAIDRYLDWNSTTNQNNLADIFNHGEVFYCFDNMTGMTDIARLCGCPTVIIPNGEYTKEQYLKHETGWEGLGWGVNETKQAIDTMDSSIVRKRYLELFDTFQEKLTYFIEKTQG